MKMLSCMIPEFDVAVTFNERISSRTLILTELPNSELTIKMHVQNYNVQGSADMETVSGMSIGWLLDMNLM